MAPREDGSDERDTLAAEANQQAIAVATSERAQDDQAFIDAVSSTTDSGIGR